MMFISKLRSIVMTTGLCGLSLAGCVSEGGSAASSVAFDLVAGFHAEASALKDGHFVDQNQHEIALNKLSLHLAEIRLLAKSSSGGNGQVFDPTQPPEPYENCHANHCHIKGSSDTKTYAEIEAELSGGTVTSKDVLVLSPNRSIEITSLSAPVRLHGVASGDLPYGEVQEIRVVFDTISLHVTDETAQQEITLQNAHQHGDHVHVEPLELSHAVDMDVVYGKEADQEIELMVEIDANILGQISGDDVDFADLMAEFTTLELQGHDDHHDHE